MEKKLRSDNWPVIATVAPRKALLLSEPSVGPRIHSRKKYQSKDKAKAAECQYQYAQHPAKF